MFVTSITAAAQPAMCGDLSSMRVTKSYDKVHSRAYPRRFIAEGWCGGVLDADPHLHIHGAAMCDSSAAGPMQTLGVWMCRVQIRKDMRDLCTL